MQLSKCIHCGAYINPAYGDVPPAEHMDHAGTKEDPRAPGDWNNVCERLQLPRRQARWAGWTL